MVSISPALLINILAHWQMKSSSKGCSVYESINKTHFFIQHNYDALVFRLRLFCIFIISVLSSALA